MRTYPRPSVLHRGPCRGLRTSTADRARVQLRRKNPITGEMEEFHSHKLQDDLPEEEAAEGDVVIPTGDDY